MTHVRIFRWQLDDYDAQPERYRELVAGTDLDSRSRRTMSDGQPVTMRFVLLHLVEETARHNGHLDLLRELADGHRRVTGVGAIGAGEAGRTTG